MGDNAETKSNTHRVPTGIAGLDEMLGGGLLFNSVAVVKGAPGTGKSCIGMEYIARGIPFVYAYADVDLKGDEPFALKLPAEEKALDVEKIVEFSYSASKMSDMSETMRAFARNRLDWTIKMNDMIDFVNQIPL